MMTSRRGYWLLWAFWCAAGAANTATPAMTIFTTAAFPVAEHDAAIARVVAVDRVLRLNRDFMVGIPAQRDAARDWVNARLNSPAGHAFLAALGPATEELALAWSFRLRALPAVLLEDGTQRYVVYGTTDTQRALAQWMAQPTPGAMP